ncbi:MAG: class I SAM-dependent methyltransferase [Planctomycetaceae bacterium]
MPSALAAKLRARMFGDKPTNMSVYHDLIAKSVEPGMTVLDVGCGRGVIAPYPWHNHEKIKLWGIDPDPTAAENPHLESFTLLTDDPIWKIPSGSVDLAVARYVLEHVDDPTAFFSNLSRVLKPGGKFLFLTPNRWHPAMIASHWLPYGLKQRILALTKRADPHDVFPTCYRLNSARAVTQAAQRCGLNITELRTREIQPCGYLDFSVLGYFASCAYFATMRATGLQRFFGMTLTGVLSKPLAAPAATRMISVEAPATAPAWQQVGVPS